MVSTGRVIGDIRTKSLVVDENAVFQGQCTMNTEGMSSYAAGAQEKTEEPKKEEEHNLEKENNNGSNNKWNKR